MQTTTFKPFPISNSRKKAFDCPHYFYRKYIEKVAEGQVNPRLHAGRFGHAVIEEYDKALMASKNESDFQLFEEILEKQWHNDKILSEDMYEETRQKLLGFAERHTINLEYTYGAEVAVALNWDCEKTEWRADDVWVRAKLDRVEIIGQKSRITDYKMQPYAPQVSELRKDLQALIYPWVLSKLNPNLVEFEVVFDYITWGTQRVMEFTKDDIEAIEDRLRRFTKKVMSKIEQSTSIEGWPAQRCGNCAICPFECPLTIQGIEIIQTAEQAKKVGMQIEAVKEKVSKMQSDLKEWSKTQGKVDIGIGVYGFNNSESIKAKPADVVDLCLSEGLEVNDFLQKNSDKIKKLKDDDPELYEKFADLAGTNISTKFGYQEKKGDKE